MTTADKKTNPPVSAFFKVGILFLLNLIIVGTILLEHAAAQERVRMALSVRNVVFLPFYYAKDTKIFDRHGLNVELIQMRSDLQLAGLASGEIDFTPSVGPAGAAIANGLPVKALAVLYRAPLFSLVSPASLASVKALEGKTVAVSRIGDRKSTRLNSSHSSISYAVFCLKKKKKKN